MGRKMTAGNSAMFGPTSIKDMTNTSHLDYDKPYTEFNYDKYTNNFRQSNFVGGKNKTYNNNSKKLNKKLNNDIKLLFCDYKDGAKSNIKQLNKKYNKTKIMKGGQQFIVPLKEMKDVSQLDYSEQFQYNEMKHIPRIPRSNMLLGE